MIRKHTVAWSVLVLAVAGVVAGIQAQERVAAERTHARRPAVPGVHGLVTAGHPLASMAGMRVLLEGGNAVDAAVAVLATLNVVRPQMSGAAGNGFFLIYDKVGGTVHSLGATGAAPLGLQPESLSADDLLFGMQAGATPGLFGGWIAALDRFGTMNLADVLESAIDYAENGHPIEATVVDSIRTRKPIFEQFPTSARMFLPGGRAPMPNEKFRMPDLASTFKKVVGAEQAALQRGASRSQGLRAAFDRFYKGDIAQEMARFYERHGGPFTLEDFAHYQPVWAEPVHSTYRGYDVYSSPPTSRGGLEVLMQLSLVEASDLKALGHNSAETLHFIIEAIKLAKSDVYQYVADPQFANIPLTELLSKEHAKKRRGLIDDGKAMTFPEPADLPGGLKSVPSQAGARLAETSQAGSTTAFSIADKYGNVVACTPTHGSAFGTGVVVGSTGLTFNNGTRVGSTAPYPGHVNYVRPGQIPLLNNSPVIVLKDGEFVLALGTPGGETIGQTQFQVALNVLDFGMSVQEAVAAPRIALSAEPNFYRAGASVTVQVEKRIPEQTLEKLRGIGHVLEPTGGYELGSVQAILVDRDTRTMEAGADPRRVAYAIGW